MALLDVLPRTFLVLCIFEVLNPFYKMKKQTCMHQMLSSAHYTKSITVSCTEPTSLCVSDEPDDRNEFILRDEAESGANIEAPV